MLRQSVRPLAAAFRAVAAAPCTRRALPITAQIFQQQSPSRFFTTGAASATQLAPILETELQHEKTNYEQAATITTFLEKSGWRLAEKEGDVNVTLSKSVNDMSISVEFQMVSPAYPGEEEDGEGSSAEGGASQSHDTTEFTVSCEKQNGNGAVFCCSTVSNDDKYRFIVGNIRYYSSADEKANLSAYAGPEFEDLDDKLQTAIDEWIESIGINEELCDFIDAMAVDKEQREYMRWLECIAKIVK